MKVKVEIRIKIILNIPLISLINQSVYYNMSDSEDFVDDNATEESEDELEPNQPRINCGKRGKNIPWQEMKTFATTKDYNDSEFATDIKDKFSARAIRESDAAETIHYTCKFARKVGWQVCPMMLRLKFMANCDVVLV